MVKIFRAVLLHIAGDKYGLFIRFACPGAVHVVNCNHQQDR